MNRRKRKGLVWARQCFKDHLAKQRIFSENDDHLQEKEITKAPLEVQLWFAQLTRNFPQYRALSIPTVACPGLSLEFLAYTESSFSTQSPDQNLRSRANQTTSPDVHRTPVPPPRGPENPKTRRPEDPKNPRTDGLALVGRHHPDLRQGHLLAVQQALHQVLPSAHAKKKKNTGHGQKTQGDGKTHFTQGPEEKEGKSSREAMGKPKAEEKEGKQKA